MAFQPSLPLRHLPTRPNPTSVRRPRRIPSCNQHPPQPSPAPLPDPSSPPRKPHRGRALLVAAAAATVISFAPTMPPPTHALGLAPTPINPYARRRSERLYTEYAKNFERQMESVIGVADFRKVVEAGGGGLGVGYRIAGFAAFVASAMSTAVVHPLDSVKTRMQAWGKKRDQEGEGLFDDLYNGIWSNVLKEAPNAAIYLGVYELIKASLMGLSVTSFFHDVPLITFLVAGALGDAIGSIVRVPAEIVNKRLQLGVNRDWKDAARGAFLSPAGREGSSVAWQAVLWRDVPYGGLQIMLYEFGKQLLATHPGLCGGVFANHAGVMVDAFMGALAGALAAMVTTPADVLVTKLSVQHPQSYLETGKYMDVGATARRILQDEGVGGFFKGTWQRGLYYAPMIGLFFALYEFNRGWLADPAGVVGWLGPIWGMVVREWEMLPAQVVAVYSVASPVLAGILSLVLEGPAALSFAAVKVGL